MGGQQVGIIGREHPAQQLRAEITRALGSYGGLVLVTGEAGIGKTTLVSAAAEEARQAGALVLSGTCWDSAAAPGYWPWTQVVRGLRRADPQRQLTLGLRALLGEATSEPLEPFQIYDAFTTELVAMSQRQPVVVILDDLHWADGASLRLLEFAVQHTWFERVLFIGTYRDAEVDAAEHPLRPFLLALLAKATTVTLTGLAPDAVAALIERTAGRHAEAEMVAEVHLRTGGNPFFIEQTARLWGAGAAAGVIAPGVREAVRQRLALLPEPVAQLLTTAAVLGRQTHRQVLAGCAAAPVAHVDRLLEHAVTARLMVSEGGGHFAFSHDLVRETIYEDLDEAERRLRHAAVVRAGVTAELVPGDLARHAYLAVGEVDPAEVVEHLLTAAREAGQRLAAEEAVIHYHRAIELATTPAKRGRIYLELGQELFYSPAKAETWRYLRAAADQARELEDADLMVRAAFTFYRYRVLENANDREAQGLLREAHALAVGGAEEDVPIERIVQDLIASTEKRARTEENDEALAFSLWARHDSIWGPGTGKERAALTAEVAQVAQRSGDRESEIFAASLRWVALLEQGDPGWADQFRSFVAMSEQSPAARYQFASLVDRQIISAMQGDFAASLRLLAQVRALDDSVLSDQGMVFAQLTWSVSMLQGDYGRAAEALKPFRSGEEPNVTLMRALLAVEQGDGETASRYVSLLDSGPSFPRSVTALWLRLLIQAGAATGDLELCRRGHAGLAAHSGEWTVSLFGCDISGPVDLWLGVAEAALGDTAAAVTSLQRAIGSAQQMNARPWVLIAQAELLRHRPDLVTLQEIEAEAHALGMRHVLDRLGAAPKAPAVNEFHFDGTVWRLGYAGQLVHLPDAKGLHDLHTLLARPGTEVAATELLDPSAGPELAAARRLGGDPVLDDEAKLRYKQRLSTLEEEIDRAALRDDTGRVAALEAERDALLQQLRAAAGLAGRTRRLGDEAERARKTVTARIRDVLRKLDQRHPALASHLREAVSTGSTCAYLPRDPADWVL